VSAHGLRSVLPSRWAVKAFVEIRRIVDIFTM
jgi:hypothetical protein